MLKSRIRQMKFHISVNSCLSQTKTQAARTGSAALQSVLIIAVALTILLALRTFWLGSDGSGGMQASVEQHVISVVSGKSDESGGGGQPDSNTNGNPGNTGGNTGGDGTTSEPPSPKKLSEHDRKRIAQLAGDARRLNGLSNLAALAGQKVQAATYKALSDAALLEIAHIRGPEALEKEIMAIAATRTMEATASAFLKAIENRIPITRFVTLPIVDGLGQLTGDFVRWWKSNQ